MHCNNLQYMFQVTTFRMKNPVIYSNVSLLADRFLTM